MNQSDNPYAPPLVDPSHHGPGGGISRDGNLLVIQRGSEGGLPQDNCLKCGAPAVTVLKRPHSWHHPALLLLLLLGLLPFLIVCTIVQKRMTLACPLCAVHQRKRLMTILFVWLSVLGIFGSIALIALRLASEWVVLAFLVCLILLLVFVYRLGGCVLKPRRITKTHGAFTGACEAFLVSLPTTPGVWK